MRHTYRVMKNSYS